MLRRLQERLEFTKGLGFRLVGLLSVAILPIGLISVIQTLHLSREYERSAEIALLGRTSSAAAGERALLQGALGSADALGPGIIDLVDDPKTCSDKMAAFVESTTVFAYAAFTGVDGWSDCLSTGEAVDMSGTEDFKAFMAEPGTMVSASDGDLLTGTSIVSVSQPLHRNDQLLGYITVAMSRDLLRSSHITAYATEGAGILTFNNRGQILSIDRNSITDASAVLPENKNLQSLLARSETTFHGRANNGEMRVFSVVPVIPGLVYALGSWNRTQSGIAGLELTRFSAILLPILLWVVSLVVSYFAVYRLVLRHISVLRKQMRRFAIADRSTPPPVLESAPAEIADMSQTFHNMARILIRDEDALESAVNEKTVLLKEVHHRVKNNLQLIASIINMQIRVLDHADAKRVLRSVQDRVTSLATIYRNLYQAEHLDSVQADRLISDIVNQMANSTIDAGTGLQIDARFDPLELIPDQAVPLSLLATEAFTNAIKYAQSANEGESPWVRILLVCEEGGTARLEIVNSTGDAPATAEGTGLGSQLIEAFATQLDGEIGIESSEGQHALRLRFRPEPVRRRIVDDDKQHVVFTSAARDGSSH